MKWYEAVDQLRPHVVQIITPEGSGTGFLLWRSRVASLCAIATAGHVVDHASSWEELLRVRVASSGQVALLRPAERAIFVDSQRDTAVVLFDSERLSSLPPTTIDLISRGRRLRVGVTIGWLGFPAIPAADLCFFTGTVSAKPPDLDAYFVDGVAINGVSGGPAFSVRRESFRLIGVVSAYIPNRATGETLPGLAIVRDVTQFHDAVQAFLSVDEAKEKEAAASAESPPPPPPPAEAESVPSRARRAT